MRGTSIPTTYNGVNFRSRLEAKWAAFFDLAGWRWNYEPIDLNRWIPDFVLHGADGKVLVEVKPAYEIADAPADKISAQAIDAGWTGDLLILGAEIGRNENFACARLGWLGELHTKEAGEHPALHWWQDAILHDGGGIGFCGNQGSFKNRITGFCDGDSGVGGSDDDRIEAMWKQAGNAVQWRAP